MAQQDISDLRSPLGDYVKNISQNTTLADAQAIETIRHWCEKTGMWTEDATDIALVADQSEYTLTLPTTNGDSLVVHSIEWARCKKDGASDDDYWWLTPINPVQQTYPISAVHASKFYEDDENAKEYWLTKTKKIRIHPIPGTSQVDDNVQANCIVKPDYDATTFPDFIFDDYKHQLCWGIAAKILSMATYKWYDPKLADYYQEKYRVAVHEEADNRQYGRTRNPGIVVPQWAFTGGARNRSTLYSGGTGESGF